MVGGSDPKITETYMVPGVGPSSTVSFAQPLARLEYNMSNEGASKYILGQGLSYPAANSYGEYCTGFEPNGEWGDHYGLDGQNLHYSGLQTESLPYVYYTPTYGYMFSSPDQYGPFVPGAVVGLDGSFIGTQPFIASPAYQPPVSPSAYVPVFVQPTSDFPLDYSLDQPMVSCGPSIRPANLSIKSRAQAYGNATASLQMDTSVSPIAEASRSSPQNQCASMPPGRPVVSMPRSNQTLSNGTTVPIRASFTKKDQNPKGLMQATNRLSHGLLSSFDNRVKVTSPSLSSLTNLGASVHGWASGEEHTPTNGTNPNVLVEQNKGPRTNSSKGPAVIAEPGGADQSKSSSSNGHGSIIIQPTIYNMDDFKTDYPDAKFFVIKSYSEDDVHKSIKYNVWSSTPNGNRRLDAAYTDAQTRSLEKPMNCPVFLFFSVNASGQFCGVAEMIGPVDFHEDMIFWQQDKWPGSFPVKWHIIKDVPNSSFRHVILENNENKPVTNSRDTQEIPYNSGMSMLKRFKDSPLMTSVLDDFPFYEERQKMMLEAKCRRLGRSFDASLYVPAFVAPSRTDVAVDQSIDASDTQPHDKDASSDLVEQDCVAEIFEGANQNQKDAAAPQLPKNDRKMPVVTAMQPSMAGEMDGSAVDHPPKATQNSPDDVLGKPSRAGGKQPGRTSHPPNADERIPSDLTEFLMANGKHLKNKSKQKSQSGEKNPSDSTEFLMANGMHLMNKSEQKPESGESSLVVKDAISFGEIVVTKEFDAVISSDDGDGNAQILRGATARNSVKKSRASFKELSEGKSKSLGNKVENTMIDVVKVGSVHIKVKVGGECSSEIVKVGINPLGSKGGET